MLKIVDEQVVRLLKERIQKISPIQRVIVFGSRARGDAFEESDLDVFTELPLLTLELRKQLYDIAWEVGFDHDRVVSLLLTTTLELTEGPLSANPILKAIEMEGIPV
jgi:predicted nucleotidyltransferase